MPGAMADHGPDRPTPEGGGTARSIASSCLGELLLRASGLFYLLACAGGFLTFEPLWIASSVLLLIAAALLYRTTRRRPENRRLHIVLYIGLLLAALAMVLFIGLP